MRIHAQHAGDGDTCKQRGALKTIVINSLQHPPVTAALGEASNSRRLEAQHGLPKRQRPCALLHTAVG
ncbi:hypothetical protein [Xanthomonas vasicola]|uniref:hypothetical protein n=1 Tax=Xanthomonas vasicola TaxID=56459 RepID=UPI00034BC274|nr:hypothetical protein [Xanthomonas vasicola]MDO6952337.1 hypothetical protein [Xanthomonas vasicola]